MTYVVDFSPLARLELLQAEEWYSQENIQKADAFFADVARTEQFLQNNPYLYAKVEGEIRRAVLKRFPYALFYTVDNETVTVLSCFHQSREPLKFSET
jgi:plasmid stabilization system protein ParE